MTVAQQVSQVRKSAESMDAAKTERIGSPSDYDVVRQGDLYLICLPQAVAGSKTKVKQLAPGTSQGSRHVAVGNVRITVPSNKEWLANEVNNAVPEFGIHEELIGPQVECLGDDSEISHPEHGNKILPKGTVWAVVYQRAYAEEIRRVMD